MIILAIRTDNPQAELALYNDNEILSSITWQAHRELSDTIHLKINQIAGDNKIKLQDLGGVIIFRGPGSFTGLRIGFSVANALANSYQIPIVSSDGEDWQTEGIEQLLSGSNEVIARPEYGSPPNTTAPKS